LPHSDSTPHDPLDGIAETIDRAAVATIAHFTRGLSPATLAQAFADWGLHLALSPGKCAQLMAKLRGDSLRLAGYVGSGMAGVADDVSSNDRRFADPAWAQPPFNLMAAGFLLGQQWWADATRGVMGVTSHHEDIVAFTVRQLLDIAAPTNAIVTNPVVQKRIAATGGACLVEGARLWLEDVDRETRGEPPVGADAFPVGQKLAITPGRVVFRNRLIELIQYAPTTPAVRAEPILIVPAWIMKYYILDLQPHNSLIRWLVDQGHTVFCISWHNPVSVDRDLDMDTYRLLGPMAAMDAVAAITGASRIHTAGYCLGGTLLAIAAAAAVRSGDQRFASITLFAAQTEFSEPGELGLFIDEAQVSMLENMMWSRGYLDSRQMGGAFQMLRSNDLIWSRMLSTYLMGEREPMTDLMAWNADGTRMPYQMHSQYLRRLFLNDELAEGHYRVDGRVVSLSTLRMPFYVVGTERDHIAPWHSVHKIHLLTNAEIRFILTSGGHNAGIVSEPGHKGRHYRALTREADKPLLGADEWHSLAELHQGSWWPDWGQWLAAHSGPDRAPPPMGNEQYPALEPAPGRYVLEK
jgi:polyhydroxyalkanoate synthase